MTPDDVYASVLAFLDQFIARGAAADVIELRARLAVDLEVRELLAAQLSTSDATDREAFDAMTAFFAAMRERGGRSSSEPGPDLVDLISWTSWGWATDDGERETADPAQWHDWLASVEVATRKGGP